MGAEAEVADGLAVGAGATEQKGVLAGGGAAGELVKSEDLTASLEDAGTGTLGEAEGSDGDLGGLEETVVVGDGANNDNGLALGTLLLKSTGDSRKRHGRAVDLGQEQGLENDLVEARFGAASKEAVQLHEQTQVRILRLRLRAVTAAGVLFGEVVLSHCRVGLRAELENDTHNCGVIVIGPSPKCDHVNTIPPSPLGGLFEYKYIKTK